MASNILHLLLALTLASIVNCATKLPSGVSQHQFCHGCVATMKELEKKIPKKSKGRDVAVIEAMEQVCSNENFREYQYSPPKTVKACKILLDQYEEEIESALMKTQGDVVTSICNELTGACDGVDMDNKDAKYSDIDLTNDGEGTKSVKIDPSTGKVEKEKEDPQDGKKLSKSDKKKKSKKTKKSKKAEKEEERKPDGKEKGSIHNLNIDINDPSSIQRVMEQINNIKRDIEEKDEL